MSTLLFCSRPHAKTVDFDNSRFIVAASCGINVEGERLARGDEVPFGALNATALRAEYEPPLRRIELLEYALADPNLRAECLARGTIEEEKPQEPSPSGEVKPARKIILGILSRKELATLCRKHGLPDGGSTTALRNRLRAVVE